VELGHFSLICKVCRHYPRVSGSPEISMRPVTIKIMALPTVDRISGTQQVREVTA
jgi:hypothetical protein